MSTAQHSSGCSGSQRTSKRDLVCIVEAAYADMSAETLDSVFSSLQQAMEGTMLAKGGDNYQLRHIAKATLRRGGKCPPNIQYSRAAVEAIAGMK